MLSSAASAQQIATSPRPEAVSVTIYRDVNRPAQQAMNLQWLNGYALISETRRLTIPIGEGELRFEGVAGGIIPESAIVTGLPDGVVEKNQDAYLLSPASLLDRSLGARVRLRRTSQATGAVREQEAVVRSGPSGAVVLQTAEGFESLRCTGLKETISYARVPPGLSAKPTLSVRARSTLARTATVTLSYLATGFDWQANYLATLNPAGDRIDLFAWVTLASGDQTSFVDASAQTVAGRLNRERSMPRPQTYGGLNLDCWPAQTTSDIPESDGYSDDYDGYGPPPAVSPPPPPPPVAEAIVVTGSRIARQEELGDLKLYRIPDRTTVAANSQKQVALLEKGSVKVQSRYRQRLGLSQLGQPIPAERLLVTKNRTLEGLGLPLPAGRLVLFGAGRERPLLLGEGFLDDHAVGEDVEVVLSRAPGVTTTLVQEPGDRFTLTATNDTGRAAPLDVEFHDGRTISSATRLGRRDGRPLWTTSIPANGTATLVFTATSQ